MIKYEVLGGSAGTSDYHVLGPLPCLQPCCAAPNPSGLLSQSLPISPIALLSLTKVCLLATQDCHELTFVLTWKPFVLQMNFLDFLPTPSRILEVPVWFCNILHIIFMIALILLVAIFSLYVSFLHLTENSRRKGWVLILFPLPACSWHKVRSQKVLADKLSRRGTFPN